MVKIKVVSLEEGPAFGPLALHLLQQAQVLLYFYLSAPDLHLLVAGFLFDVGFEVVDLAHFRVHHPEGPLFKEGSVGCL
jgi:hypothetical protein